MLLIQAMIEYRNSITYDFNCNGIVERAEVVAAVVDFFAGRISRSTAVAVVVAFFSA